MNNPTFSNVMSQTFYRQLDSLLSYNLMYFSKQFLF